MTPSATPSATRSAVPNPTRSATKAPTSVPSVTPSRTPSFSPLPSATAAATPLLTATAEPGGEGKILKVVALPNPNPSQIAVELGGGSSALVLRIYSTSFQRLAEVVTPPESAGWVRIALPSAFLSQAPNGVYFYRVMEQNDPHIGLTGRLVITR